MAEPTAKSLRLGMALKRLRQDAGKSLEAVAEELAVGKTTVHGIETAQRPIKPGWVRILLPFYGIEDKATIEKYLALAREADKPGWWLTYKNVLPGQHLHTVALESEATHIYVFEASIVPGLLQTADLARQVMEAGPRQLDPAEVERRVEARIQRQERLRTGKGLKVQAIIGEAALARTAADPEIMRGQCEHLLELAKLRHIDLRILPLSAMLGVTNRSLTLLDFDDIDLSYSIIETPLGDLIFQDAGDVDQCRDIYTQIAEIAMDREESLAVIGSRME